MAGYDFSRVSDSELEAVMDDLINNPLARFATPVARRQAVVAEYNRRRATPATNVQADLEAAAAPVDLDPPLTPKAPRDWASATDDELVANLEPVAGGGMGIQAADVEAYGERYRQAVRNVIDRGVAARQAARGEGWNDPEAVAYNAATGVDAGGVSNDPDTVTVDGVTFPAHRMSDGQPFNGMYTLRALREAKDAQREAQLAEMFSKSAQEDLAKYGTRQLYEYGDDFDAANVTPIDPASLNPEERKQQEQLEARRQIEKRQYAQNKALRARASGQYEADRKKARDRFTAMAMLAGGSQNINAGNRAMFNALLELPPAERQEALRQLMPMDPIRAKVEAENAAMGGRMAQAAMTAFLTNNPQATPEQRALLDLQMREREHALPPAVAAQRERARTGAVPGASPAGQRLLADIETRVIGPYATQVEVDAAVEEAVDSGVPREDAERYFSRRRNWGNWWGGGAEVE